MKRVRRFKLKTKYVGILRIFGIFICILIGLFIFYRIQISDLIKLGYSSEASRKILFSFKKDYVLSKGENKTLNAAFMSSDYKEKYLDNYARIKYVGHKDLISNINKLLKVGYSNSDINLIITHGSNSDVMEFARREKVRYLEEFFIIDYAKIKYYDRYIKYADETGEDCETTVLNVNLNMDMEDYKDALIIDKFAMDMLVNKHRGLSKDFKPVGLSEIDSKYTSGEGVEASKIAINAFIEMSKAALKEDMQLVINSAYRSYDDQQQISDTYLELYGQSYVDRYVAKPGFSEHQTGLAFDIGSRKVNIFAKSEEYEWMLENAYKYGFILRFPKKYEAVTGFRNEPWHYRYVGKKIAKVIYEEDITLEEYYAKYLDK